VESAWSKAGRQPGRGERRAQRGEATAAAEALADLSSPAVAPARSFILPTIPTSAQLAEAIQALGPDAVIVTGGSAGIGRAVAAALFTIAVARFMERLKMAFLLLDALGLVVFTVTGCMVAMEMGQPVLIVIVAGMITGCVGGVLRDVLCNDVPLLFSGELYATVSAATACIFFFGLQAGVQADLMTIVAIAIGFTLRVLAIVFKIEMPRFVYAPVRDQSSKR
jgi:uncharacterized membrane protein YeiH